MLCILLPDLRSSFQFFSLSPQLSCWFFVMETTMLGSTDTFLGVYIYHHLLMLLPFPDICL